MPRNPALQDKILTHTHHTHTLLSPCLTNALRVYLICGERALTPAQLDTRGQNEMTKRRHLRPFLPILISSLSTYVSLPLLAKSAKAFPMGECVFAASLPLPGCPFGGAPTRRRSGQMHRLAVVGQPHFPSRR